MRLILAVALSIVYANAVSCCGETQKEHEKPGPKEHKKHKITKKHVKHEATHV